ncbi:MAG: SDR family oxidoreductase [Pseudomonadota bacterium]|nr:SDR family oxidoreductase [Pseudomonadota bacterium]
MKIDLRGRTVVVTGGSSGIGLETAKLFLEAGANVSICGRNQERLEQAESELASNFSKNQILFNSCDVLDKKSLDGLVEATANKFGGTDTLINNAGQGRMSRFDNTDDAAWKEELESKFFGVLYPSKAFQPLLEKSGSAAIVCTGSLLAQQPELHLIASSAARAGQLNLLHSMARELAPLGIRVNSILIGVVKSGQWQRRFEDSSSHEISYETWLENQAKEKGIPLARFGTPKEAAWALFYLGSPLSSYTTGSTIDVSGGFSRHVG